MYTAGSAWVVISEIWYYGQTRMLLETELLRWRRTASVICLLRIALSFQPAFIVKLQVTASWMRRAEGFLRNLIVSQVDGVAVWQPDPCRPWLCPACLSSPVCPLLPCCLFYCRLGLNAASQAVQRCFQGVAHARRRSAKSLIRVIKSILITHYPQLIPSAL